MPKGRVAPRTVICRACGKPFISERVGKAAFFCHTPACDEARGGKGRRAPESPRTRRTRLGRQAWGRFATELTRDARRRRKAGELKARRRERERARDERNAQRERERCERKQQREATRKLKAVRTVRMKLAKAAWREFLSLVKVAARERAKRERQAERQRVRGEREFEQAQERMRKARQREAGRQAREREREEQARQRQIESTARKRMRTYERTVRKRRLRIFEPVLDDPNQMLVVEDLLEVAAKAGTAVPGKEELRKAIVRLSKAQGVVEVHQRWQEVAAIALKTADRLRPRVAARDPEVPGGIEAEELAA